MIARHWHGRVQSCHAERFAGHLRAAGIAVAAAVPGYAGARVRRTEDGTSADFELITYWYTWAAVRRFAGDDLDRAVLYPGDEVDLDPAPRVEHRELAPGTVAITGGHVVPVDGDPIDGGTVLITGGHVVPVDGDPIDGGTVLITGGRIIAVGPDVPVPEDVPVADAGGRWVLPGMVEAHAHLGIDEPVTAAVDRHLVAEAPRTVGRADEAGLRERGRPLLIRLPECADGGNPELR